MANINLELRIPLVSSFGFVLFNDIGYLSKGRSDENFSLHDSLLVAIGFGLRYFTPLGPLRFDIGWRPGGRAPDKALSKQYAWFVTLGHAF